MSPDTSHCMEAVFSMVRKLYRKQPGDQMEDLNVNLAIWRKFVNTTLRSAVHLGKDYDTNLRCVKNYHWKTTGQLVRKTERLISGQTETTGISLTNFQDSMWVSTSLLHSRAYQCSTAKVYVFSDSVLCLGKMGGQEKIGAEAPPWATLLREGCPGGGGAFLRGHHSRLSVRR